MQARMKIYTVHINPAEPNAAQKPVFVREGFNFFAFLFTFFWALYHRLWLPALLILVVNVVLALLVEYRLMGAESLSIVQIAFNIMVGFHANDWRRAGLSSRGYITADIAAADSELRAEQRYFERYLASGQHA